MKKTNKVFYSKEFLIGKPKKRNKIVLWFVSRGVTFELSFKEWVNIVKFLKMTVSKKTFHKNAKGYISFKIDKNDFKYQRHNQADFFSRSFLFVNLFLGKVKLQLQWEDFVRFRKFCISTNGQISAAIR